MVINRMLSLNLLISFYLVANALTDRCPSTNSCVCSPDLTTVACTSQRLTDDFFLNLDIQFPQSTVVLNLSSNFFSSISALSNLDNLQTLDLSSNRLQSLPTNLFTKFPQLSSLYLQDNSIRTIPRTFNEVSNINLDLSNNPLNCTCPLKWILKWFETINLRGPINCHEKDFCSSKKSFLHITPEQSQIVYENDSFALNCSANSKTFWTLNNEMYSSNAEIVIPHLQPNHSGVWTCHSATHNRSVSLHVLNMQSNHFCPSIQMDTSKGYFYWPRTLTGQNIQLRCPFGPAAWFARYAQASYACSRNRQWVDLDLSQCAFRTNVSREFDRILSHNQSNLLSKLVTFMSKTDASELQFDDVIFLIDLIDEEQSKYISSKKNIEEIAMLVYRLTDFILQVKQDFIIIKEYQAALNRLRAILEQLLSFTDHSWIYVGKQLTAMTLESPLPPTVCFIPDRPLLTIICGIVNRHFKRHESNLATIQFPSRSNASANQSSTFKIIFFRQATLFTPNVKSSNNAVIYMKPVVASNASVVKLTFYGESSQASIGTWNGKQTSWQIDPPMCSVTQRTIDLLSADCIFTKDTPLSITYRTRYEETRSLFLNANYLELAIYVSSIIASACFCVCILFYVCCHKVYLMPRSFFHCLINYWLSLAMLFPLFAFGIRQTHYLFLCQFFAISLHYLCLTTILWLTLLAYCIWQKLYDIWSGRGHGDDADGNPGKSSVTIVDYDDDGLPIMKLKTKPIIQFYLMAYGISFIICGINVAISREQYITNKICFLNNFESLLTLFIPIIIFVFLLLTFLLAARLNIKRLTQEAIRLRNSPDETEADPETNVESDDLNLSTKPNETVPIIIPSNHPNPEQALPHMDCRQSHLDSLCSSDMDHQHQPANQLLSILFQLFLLICVFLASLSIYIHPLQSFHIRFEHSIYNHLYGALVLLLAFYVLAFYVLTRSDLTMHCQYYACCSSRTKKRLLNQSYSEPPPPPQTPQLSPAHPLMPLSKELDEEKTILHQHLNPDDSFTEQIPAPSPPHSHYSTNIYQNQLPQNGETASMTNGQTFGSKHQTTVASKYYARHRHMLKTSISASETSLQQNESIAPSTLNTIRQESPTFLDTEQVQPRSPYAPSPKKPLYSPKDGHIFQNGNPHLHLPTLVSPRIFLRPATLNVSPRLQVSPSQAIIRPLPIVRLSSPSLDKTYPTPSPLVNTNGYASPHIESTPGRSSYRIMPSPSTEERQATYVYLNKNSHLIQQDPSPKEKPSVWKKPVNGHHHHHHPHVAFIDEDEEGSVSLKSSTCDSPTATSSSTASPVVSRKDRSRTISSSSSSSSTYSNGYPTGAVDNEQIVLHESSV